MPNSKLYAIIQAATLVVVCPHCGEDQPSPNQLYEDENIWAISQVGLEAGKKRKCVSCDEEFTIMNERKVQIAS